ncbi:hypothetical protein ACRAWF_15340 [Streptomyces sp. L7]
MTRTAGDALPRRSFLAAMVAAGVVAGGLVVIGAPKAGAATGADVTWRITSEPADAKAGYAAVLNAVRTAISVGRVRPEVAAGDAPAPLVDVTDSGGTNSYITVDMHAEDRPEFIRVFVQRSDAYVMGWFTGTEDGAGAVTWGDFFPLETGLERGQNGIPLGRPSGTLSRTDAGSQTGTAFIGASTYTALEHQGASRDGMQHQPRQPQQRRIGSPRCRFGIRADRGTRDPSGDRGTRRRPPEPSSGNRYRASVRAGRALRRHGQSTSRSTTIGPP